MGPGHTLHACFFNIGPPKCQINQQSAGIGLDNRATSSIPSSRFHDQQAKFTVATKQRISGQLRAPLKPPRTARDPSRRLARMTNPQSLDWVPESDRESDNFAKSVYYCADGWIRDLEGVEQTHWFTMVAISVVQSWRSAGCTL